MTTSMNKRTHFFIKIYLSHFILERVYIGCVWEVSWRRGQTATYWPKFFWPSQHFFLILAGLLNCGSLRAQSPLSAAGSHAGILSPTDSNCSWNWPKLSVAPGYIIVSYPSAYLHRCILFTQVHLLIDGLVNFRIFINLILNPLLMIFIKFHNMKQKKNISNVAFKLKQTLYAVFNSVQVSFLFFCLFPLSCRPPFFLLINCSFTFFFTLYLLLSVFTLI